MTLRVYVPTDAATPCAGEVYTDDGHSFDYRRGQFARIGFRCSRSSDGSLQIAVAKQQGSFTPWWHSYRLEVYGWKPTQRKAIADREYSLESAGTASTVTVPANPAGETVTLR